MLKFEDLKGKILQKIDGEIGSEEIVFWTTDGEIYKLYHEQDWCEGVDVVDIVGEFKDLIGAPILLAEEVVHDNEDPEGIPIQKVDHQYWESFTWTFYKLATIKGYVTIRWYGESNGYYSESVNFAKIQRDDIIINKIIPVI